MKRGISTLSVTMLLVGSAACASMFLVTVIEQTQDTAIIKGIDNSPEEAIIRAKNKGREILGGDVQLTKDARCNQEFAASQQGASTYWTCVVSLKKAP